MQLTEKEYGEYLRTSLEFLFYVGIQLGIISSDTKFNDFVDLDYKIKFKCREAFLKNGQLLDDYLTSNAHSLTNGQISVLTGFQKQIHSDFVILKCLAKHAIFIDTRTDKLYAVKSLSDPFDDFFNNFPVLVKTTILPFYDQIIYDGFIEPTTVYLGPEITRSLKAMYTKAKKLNQIRTSI